MCISKIKYLYFFTNSLNRTYTISKENGASGRGTMERQMWDKQYNAPNSQTLLNSSNLNTNEKKMLANEINEIPSWVECTSEKQ